MKPAFLPDIERALTDCGLFGNAFELIPVAGGEVNTSFQLHCPDQRYFLKRFDQDELLPASREQQYSIQRMVAEHQLTMAPVYFNPELGFQVEQWYPGSPLSDTRFDMAQKIALFAEVLARIHRLPFDAPLLNLPQIWSRYLEKSGQSQDLAVQSRFEKACDVWQQERHLSTVLCHNDLSLMHICTDKGLKVFDWEYAAMGNPFYDLMSCASVNGFSPHQTERLIIAYCSHTGLDLQQAEIQCNKQKELVALTTDLWFAAIN